MGERDAFACKLVRTSTHWRKTRPASPVPAAWQASDFVDVLRSSRAPAGYSIVTPIGPLNTTTSFAGWLPGPKIPTGALPAHGDGRKVSPRRHCAPISGF